MRKVRRGILGAAALFALLVSFGAAARAQQTPPVNPAATREITLPSALPSGNAAVDTIHFRFFPGGKWGR